MYGNGNKKKEAEMLRNAISRIEGKCLKESRQPFPVERNLLREMRNQATRVENSIPNAPLSQPGSDLTNGFAERAGVDAEDISLVVPHQANVRIIETALKRLGIPFEKAAMVLEHTGNTSAASIPLALVDALDHSQVNPGDLILMVGFGAGMSSAAAVVRWDPPQN